MPHAFTKLVSCSSAFPGWSDTRFTCWYRLALSLASSPLPSARTVADTLTRAGTTAKALRVADHRLAGIAVWSAISLIFCFMSFLLFLFFPPVGTREKQHCQRLW